MTKRLGNTIRKRRVNFTDTKKNRVAITLKINEYQTLDVLESRANCQPFELLYIWRINTT